MMKILPLLFLLDFSGSMDQVFEGKVKSEMMKTNIQGLLETMPDDQNIEALIYGSHPPSKCADFVTLEGSGPVTKKKLLSLRPGAFGKSPLSEGLKKISLRAIEVNASHIVTLTDGGDTCGQDPCKALVEANDTLAKNNKYLNLILIAFDLKKDRRQIQCFKTLKLSNLKISLMEGAKSDDIYNLLTDLQKNLLGLKNEGDKKNQDEESSALTPKQKGAGVSESENSQELEDQSSGSKNAREKNKNEKKNESANSTDSSSYIEITGAPPSAEFRILGTQIDRSWHGSFALEMKPGDYSVTFIDPAGLTLPTSLKAGDIKQIPWGLLMKNPTSPLVLKQVTLGFSLKADATTQKIHGAISDRTVEANIVDQGDKIQDLPFGIWTMEVTDPVWLRGQLPVLQWAILRGKREEKKIEEIFKTKINWVKNPYPTQMSVLEIKRPDTSPERYLLTPGQQKLPIPKNAKVRFLLGETK